MHESQLFWSAGETAAAVAGTIIATFKKDVGELYWGIWRFSIKT